MQPRDMSRSDTVYALYQCNVSFAFRPTYVLAYTWPMHSAGTGQSVTTDFNVLTSASLGHYL